jgi:hypothetical protein
MKYVFRPTTASDEPSVIGLAIRVFGASVDSPFLEPALLRWKYWWPRDDFDDPRAYVLELDGRIMAHVGLWPVIVGGERGMHMMDWMADPASPGAGVSLLQKLTKRFDFIYAIGGSGMTLEVLPKFGFRVVGEACTWARPLRVLRQMLHHPRKDWRLAARFGRNFWWSRMPSRTARRCSSAVLAETGICNERGKGFFQFLDMCPTARCLTFQIWRDGRQLGYFALMVVRSQARVAGVWLTEPSAENWRITFELAQDAALRHTEACEITARAFPEHTRIAAQAAGMRLRNRASVFLYRKSGAQDGLALDFQMADNDAIFLADRAPSFLT